MRRLRWILRTIHGAAPASSTTSRMPARPDVGDPAPGPEPRAASAASDEASEELADAEFDALGAVGFRVGSTSGAGSAGA